MFSGTLVSDLGWVACFLLCACLAGIIGWRRNHTFWPWFLYGLLFGPLTVLFVWFGRSRSRSDRS